ncbi:MAG: hypothetical protein R3191_04270 [Anaerolineales bacterium]|nr:hypothetical protein [Anaerolineales bacterium]
MRSRRLRLLLSIGVVFSLAVAACAQATPTPEPTEPPAPTEAPTEPMATEVPTEEPMDEPTEEPTEEPTPEPTAAPDVAVSVTGMGEVLVNAEGMTLYAFTQDSADQSACTGGCADFWPPLTVEGEAVAGEGVNADMLATLTRADGSTQVTYNGHPLYTYSEDSAPGDVNGQGVNGAWYVVSPDGTLITGSVSNDGGYDY